MTSIRTGMTAPHRAMAIRHAIDPGFVNERLIETVLGDPAVSVINDMIREIPSNTPDWIRDGQVRRIYARVALWSCEKIPVRSLREILADRRGLLICSTELLAPVHDLYEVDRAHATVILDEEHDLVPELHFTTARVTSDTLRSRLRQGGIQSFIAKVHRLEGSRLILDPLVMGAPWLETSDPEWENAITWWATEFYEHFVEDFDEFAGVAGTPDPADFSEMKLISELGFKTCLAEILGDTIVKDWGGERSDHYTTHIRLQGRRVTAAFLLKGPAHFAPMTLNTLGKRNDQIFRLAQEPADVLVVQHCHEITPAVRATLRAFAVQPSRPRRYCLIDGRDSLRLLRAYGKVQRAKDITGGAA